jgi:thiamine biosynthesis lipoprotein
MRSSSSADVRRCRPLLGTFVEIAASHASPDDAHRAVDAAFDEVALVHRRMSFHDPDSDVGRLNREALDRAVAVHPATFEVLRWARLVAEGSDGCFDVTVAGELVRRGMLPRPRCPHEPSAEGSWRDVELLDGDHVRFHRPIWIDLGGIAKGYAVDRAIERLASLGATQGCVHAGGDLRVQGPATEQVHLRPTAAPGRPAAVVGLANGSLASSGGGMGERRDPGRLPGLHVHGARRHRMGSRTFVCVIADRCMIADALTKVVLGMRNHGAAILRQYGATAHVYTARSGWHTIGAAA